VLWKMEVVLHRGTRKGDGIVPTLDVGGDDFGSLFRS
jgi:cation transport regulator ChaC